MKKTNNLPILESKLKRHKISFSNENNKLIIGKAKIDFLAIIILIILPIVLAIGIVLFVMLNDIEFRLKIVVLIAVLISTGIFNLSRLRVKNRSNKKLKILDYKTITIVDENNQRTFNNKNIKGFEYGSRLVDEDTYEGNLYLVDRENIKHQILGFDDENEQYILDDLKWISEYLIDHVELKES